jgi:hypothetical protein
MATLKKNSICSSGKAGTDELVQAGYAELVQDLWNVELCLQASFYPFDSLESNSRLSKSDDPDVLDPTLTLTVHCLYPNITG